MDKKGCQDIFLSPKTHRRIMQIDYIERVGTMKATGIVVEYNPLHNGHVYHAQQARETTQADVVIAVMSGNFLQRGEPAFVDKWARTKMALQSGVDIVFELPYRFATAHAPIFARGAITLLDAVGCSSFCFGSEDGDITPFTNSLSLINQTETVYETVIKKAIQDGRSYPNALKEAYTSIQDNTSQTQLADLTKPNNILGFHYMEAAQCIGSMMKPTTIQRRGADYHEADLQAHKVASATGIRKSYFSTGTMDEMEPFVPQATKDILFDWQAERGHFGNWETFYPYLRYTILREGPIRLASIADITEGIENAIYRAALKHDAFQPFMAQVKSKRYTWTRIQRMLTHILTGFTVEQRETMPAPSYLRLLGMTGDGQTYLRSVKKHLTLPLISKVATLSNDSLTMDIRAADLYAMALGNCQHVPKIGLDYLTPPIRTHHFGSNDSK